MRCYNVVFERKKEERKKCPSHPQLANAQSRPRVPETDDIVPGAGDDPGPHHVKPADGPLVLAEASPRQSRPLALAQRPHGHVAVFSDDDGVSVGLGGAVGGG